MMMMMMMMMMMIREELKLTINAKHRTDHKNNKNFLGDSILKNSVSPDRYLTEKISEIFLIPTH